MTPGVTSETPGETPADAGELPLLDIPFMLTSFLLSQVTMRTLSGYYENPVR